MILRDYLTLYHHHMHIALKDGRYFNCKHFNTVNYFIMLEKNLYIF